MLIAPENIDPEMGAGTDAQRYLSDRHSREKKLSNRRELSWVEPWLAVSWRIVCVRDGSVSKQVA